MDKLLVAHTCPRCTAMVRQTPDPVSGTVQCDQCGTRFDPRQNDTTAAPPPTAPTAAWEPQAGEQVGPYTLECELGRGGMSTVWAATQQSLDRPVAVKILHDHLARQPELVRRFLREAEALIQVDHPRIVSVIDQGSIKDRPYLVTALVGRQTLRDELDKADGKVLAPDRVRQIAGDVLEGLIHAHERGLVHRDIKPENLIIDDDGNTRIADFGIAQVNRSFHGNTLTQLTGTNVIMGTVAYMAPEQAEGSASVDHRCDLYSLGVVCYEALTGHRPVGRFEDPGASLPDLPEAQQQAWDEMILQLLERDPRKRPVDAKRARNLLAAVNRLPMSDPRLQLPLDDANQDDLVLDAVDEDDDSERDSRRARRIKAASYSAHRGLMRNPDDSWLAGTCGGVGAYTGIDSGWWRLAAVIGIFIQPLFVIVVYLVASLVIPKCPDPPYRPKPLNANLPQRPDGWLAGVCEMLHKQTSVPTIIWRILFICGLPFMSWLVYIIMAAVFPRTPRQFLQFESPAGGNADDQRVRYDAAPFQPTPPVFKRNQRFWGMAAIGSGLAAIFPMAMLTTQLPGAEDGARVLVIAAICSLIAYIAARFTPKARPHAGGMGGLIMACGLLALVTLAIGSNTGEYHLLGSVITLAFIAAAGALIIAVLRKRYAAIGLTIAMLLALLSAAAVAQHGKQQAHGTDVAYASEYAAAEHSGTSFLEACSDVPSIVVGLLDSSGPAVAIVPAHVLATGLFIWAVALLGMNIMARLLGRNPEEAEVVGRRPLDPAALVVGVGVIASLFLLAASGPWGHGPGNLSLVIDRMQFQHISWSPIGPIFLLAIPFLLYLVWTGRDVPGSDYELDLEDDAIVQTHHKAKRSHSALWIGLLVGFGLLVLFLFFVFAMRFSYKEKQEMAYDHMETMQRKMNAASREIESNAPPTIHIDGSNNQVHIKEATTRHPRPIATTSSTVDNRYFLLVSPTHQEHELDFGANTFTVGQERIIFRYETSVMRDQSGHSRTIRNWTGVTFNSDNRLTYRPTNDEVTAKGWRILLLQKPNGPRG